MNPPAQDWSNLSESSRDSRNIIILRIAWAKYKKVKQGNDLAAIAEVQTRIHQLQEKLKLPKTNFLNSDKIVTENLQPQNFWKEGRCSGCGASGVFWNGGKKDQHFCGNCNPLIITEAS